MKIKETEELFRNDKKEYILDNRMGFKTWLEINYPNYLDTDMLQKMVDKFIAWYEIKYPSKREFVNYNNSEQERLMPLAKFLTHLTVTELNIINASLLVSKKPKYLKELGEKYKNLETGYIDLESLDYTKYSKKQVKILEAYKDLYNNQLILRNHIIDAISKGLLYSNKGNIDECLMRKEKFLSEITEYCEYIDLDNLLYNAEEYYLIEKEKEEKESNFIKRLLKK